MPVRDGLYPIETIEDGDISIYLYYMPVRHGLYPIETIEVRHPDY